MTTIVLPENKDAPKKPFTCELCGETDNEVTIFCGGPFFYIHPKCAEIAEKAIEGYLRRIAFDMNSLEFLVNEFHKIYESQEKQTKRTDKQ